MTEEAQAQPPTSKWKRVVAIVGAITALVAGAATFKDNIAKLFPSKQPQPSATIMGSRFDDNKKFHEALLLRPVNPDIALQKLLVSFPPSFYITNQEVIRNDGGKYKLWIPVEALVQYASSHVPDHPQGTKFIYCHGLIPVTIEADYFGKDAQHYLSKSLYEIGLGMHFMVDLDQEEAVSGSITGGLMSITFVQPGTAKEEESLDSALQERLACEWVKDPPDLN